jgi:GNAT superfamily N-acetyltransferase
MAHPMDMLIKLYAGAMGARPLHSVAIVCRKPIAPEHDLIVDWVANQFSRGWASETRVALANRPVTLFIAIRSSAPIGFCCYDTTARGFVGPIGVAESERRSGVGAALLLACLDDMRTLGYAYAVAGAVGAPDFFRRVAGATEIEASTPGIYRGMLKP